MTLFNIRRFALLLRHDLVTERKQHLFLFLGLTIGLFCLELGGFFSKHGLVFILSEEEFLANLADHLFNTFCFLAPIFIGSTFAYFKTKQRRAAYFMLPASNLEKFAARLLLTTVGYAIAFLAATVLADALRILLMWIIGGNTTFILPYFFDSVGDFFGYFGEHKLRICLGATAFFLWAFSIFLLGSAYFRRWAWVKTTCLLIAFFILLAWIFSGRTFIDGNTFTQMERDRISDVLIAVFYAISAFNVWLSYRVFSRLPVIARRISVAGLCRCLRRQ